MDEARNGQEAVQKATQDTPDLILMDRWMPMVDGIEAMRRLRADSRTADVPVLAVSAQNETPDSATAIAAGAKAPVTKLCDPDRLLDHIRMAMGRLRPA